MLVRLPREGAQLCALELVWRRLSLLLWSTSYFSSFPSVAPTKFVMIRIVCHPNKGSCIFQDWHFYCSFLPIWNLRTTEFSNECVIACRDKYVPGPVVSSGARLAPYTVRYPSSLNLRSLKLGLECIQYSNGKGKLDFSNTLDIVQRAEDDKIHLF